MLLDKVLGLLVLIVVNLDAVFSIPEDFEIDLFLDLIGIEGNDVGYTRATR